MKYVHMADESGPSDVMWRDNLLWSREEWCRTVVCGGFCTSGLEILGEESSLLVGHHSSAYHRKPRSTGKITKADHERVYDIA